MKGMLGQQILESTKDIVAADARVALEESVQEAGDGKTKLEEYGPPKVDGTSILIPVVVGTVMEEYELDQMKQKVDQKWLDRQKSAVLQRLVLRQNPTDPYYGRRSGYSMYFDPDNFTLEYLDGNIVRLRTTLVCDLDPLLSSVRGLRWDLSSVIRDLAGKNQRESALKALG